MAVSNKKRVVIVLPTYNDRESLEKFLPKVFTVEKELDGYELHALISDDVRSKDNIEEFIKSQDPKRVHLLKVQPGLGVGIIEAHKYSLQNLNPDIMAQMDADGQVDVAVLPKLVKAIEEGYDLALGSRLMKGGKNELSFSRRIFSRGASLVVRTIMGPWDIVEVTNSARAFTPELFKRINLNRLPWREQSFIVQPAFLNEAILAGARYKEVPLIFRNRDAGYSKNKVVNYTYDVITYAIDARLHKWGINVPFYKLSRKMKTLIKFSVVGLSGTFVDFLFYNFFISNVGFPPATSKVFSTEAGIINNFTWNSLWTFKSRKTSTKLWQKFLLYNLVSAGALGISVLMVKLLHSIYGDGVANILGLKMQYYNVYFFATIPPVMIWNFTVNHFVTWRHRKD